MSWEDCGFRPINIKGPAKCPRQCGDCDGLHHFYVQAEEPDGMGGHSASMYFACKHCDATAEMEVDDEDYFDGDDYENPDPPEPEPFGFGCCQFPGRCCMAGPHSPSECYTPELYEQFVRDK